MPHTEKGAYEHRNQLLRKRQQVNRAARKNSVPVAGYAVPLRKSRRT